METYGPANGCRQFARLSATWNSSISQMLEGDIRGSFLPSVWPWHEGCSNAALPPLCFTLCPRLGYKKLQGWAGHLVFNLNNSGKSSTCLILAPVLPNDLRPNKKYGGTLHPGRKDLLQILLQTPQILCVLYKGLAWHNAADSSPAYWEQKWELKGCVQTDFHSFFDGWASTIETF